MPSLFVIRGNDQGTRYELHESCTRVGRDSSNGVQLHDTEVSRQHAEIRREDGYVICDLDSSNGSFVNGRRIVQHRLVSGDHVQLGSTLLLYTAPLDDTEEELRRGVNIALPGSRGDRSQIIRSVTQEEGSRLFQFAEGAHADSWVLRARSNLELIYRTTLAVSHTLDIDRLLQRLMDLIFEWVEADRGCVMLLDPQNGGLEPRVRRGRSGERPLERITISKTILDYVMERNEGVLTSDALQDERWDSAASIAQAEIHEAICVPMQGRYEVVGVIYIDTTTPPNEAITRQGPRFKEDHLKLLVAIAHQAALAVEETHFYSALLQAERLAAVGQTVATLSHHIKNILQGISGGSYMIELGLAEQNPDVIRQGWKIVEKNQQKISRLVLDMLTFSKDREPDLGPADLNQVVGDVVELMQARAGELETDLLYHPVSQMPTLVFDAEGIHRAVLNVVTNALDAVASTEESGRVEVATAYDADARQVRITVLDDGPGIPADQLDDLFRPFISTKRSRGTGLGLPVSQKIVSEHGGQISVCPGPEGGSLFTIELPAHFPRPDEIDDASPHGPVTAPLPGKRPDA